MAPASIIDCVCAPPPGRLQEGKAVGARASSWNCSSPTSRRRCAGVFFAEREVPARCRIWKASGASRHERRRHRPGTMQRASPFRLINSGMPVTVVENNQEGIDRAMARFVDLGARDVKLGRIDQATMDKRRPADPHHAVRGACRQGHRHRGGVRGNGAEEGNLRQARQIVKPAPCWPPTRPIRHRRHRRGGGPSRRRHRHALLPPANIMRLVGGHRRHRSSKGTRRLPPASLPASAWASCRS